MAKKDDMMTNIIYEERLKEMTAYTIVMFLSTRTDFEESTDPIHECGENTNIMLLVLVCFNSLKSR